MHPFRPVFWSMVVGLFCLVSYSPAFGDYTIRCESHDYDLNRCPIAAGSEGVELVRRLSDSSCRRGDTWGYDHRGVWVDDGCAAEFRVDTRGRADRDDRWDWRDRWDRDDRSGWGRTVRCESDDYDFNRCPVAAGSEVRLVRQLSDATCRRGDTWGHDRRGIWVDEGCAAEFRVTR